MEICRSCATGELVLEDGDDPGEEIGSVPPPNVHLIMAPSYRVPL